MSLTPNNPHGLGVVIPSGEQEHLLGSVKHFADLDYSATGVKPVQSNMTITAIWVKNESGGALLPGVIPIWDTGSTYGPMKAVHVVATAGTTRGVGTIDPWIPAAGVADTKHCWLIVRGPTKFRSTTGTAVVLATSQLAVGAAGRVVVYDYAGAIHAQGNFDRCGTPLAAVAAGIASDTLFRGFADFRV